MTKAEAKRRVLRYAADLLNGSRGLLDDGGLYADGQFRELGEADAERISQAIDDLVDELARRGLEPEDKK